MLKNKTYGAQLTFSWSSISDGSVSIMSATGSRTQADRCGAQFWPLTNYYLPSIGRFRVRCGRGGSPRPPPMCSIHLDDATAAILCQNAHHTPVYWWRGDRVMKSISVWGWLGGHDGQRPVGEFGLDAGITPLLFFKGHPGIFNDHRESGPRFNISSERWCFLTV